jgi:hypothetical protein
MRESRTSGFVRGEHTMCVPTAILLSSQHFYVLVRPLILCRDLFVSSHSSMLKPANVHLRATA